MGTDEVAGATPPSPVHHQSEGFTLVNLSNPEKTKRKRNVLNVTTQKSQFPLMIVEHGCIISKDTDITVAYRWSCWKSSSCDTCRGDSAL